MNVDRVAQVDKCLAVLASPDKVSEADRKEHRRLVAREYARNTKAGQFAQLDMFRHTREGRA